MTQTWMAVDVGTSSVKIALTDSSGNMLRAAHRDYPTHAADGGVSEQNAADWWNALVEAASELTPGDDVDAIVVTGQMQDVILIDDAGTPLRPVILYSDTRAVEEMEWVETKIGAHMLRQLTGNHQDAGGLLAKLVWLTRNEPESLSKADHLLVGAADYIVFHMTGIASIDTTTASTTGLMDISTRAGLPDAILQQLGIEQIVELLPPMQPGGARVGSLTQHAAKWLHMQPGIPVYHAPGDAGAATIGAGCGEVGDAYIYLGTSGWIAFSSSEPGDPDSGVITLAHPREDRFIQIAPLLTAGGNVDWVRNLFGVDDYEQLIQEAMDQTPTSLIYLPYLQGERSPFSDPFARGTLIGLKPNSSRADVYRAVLEGVCYAFRHVRDALMKVTESRITLTGGSTRSVQWCQLLADVLGSPVDIAADAENVGLRGALISALVAEGQLETYASAAMPTTLMLTPDARHQAHFQKQYAIFIGLHEVLKDTFASLQ